MLSSIFLDGKTFSRYGYEGSNFFRYAAHNVDDFRITSRVDFENFGGFLLLVHHAPLLFTMTKRFASTDAENAASCGVETVGVCLPNISIF